MARKLFSPLSFILFGTLATVVAVYIGLRTGFFVHYAPEFYNGSEDYYLAPGFVLNLGSEFVGVLIGVALTTWFVNAFNKLQTNRLWDQAREQIAMDATGGVHRVLQVSVNLMNLYVNANNSYERAKGEFDEALADINHILRDYAPIFTVEAIKVFPQFRETAADMRPASRDLAKCVYYIEEDVDEKKRMMLEVPLYEARADQLIHALKQFCNSLDANPDFGDLELANKEFVSELASLQKWFSLMGDSLLKPADPSESEEADRTKRRKGFWRRIFG